MYCCCSSSYFCCKLSRLTHSLRVKFFSTKSKVSWSTGRVQFEILCISIILSSNERFGPFLTFLAKDGFSNNGTIGEFARFLPPKAVFILSPNWFEFFPKRCFLLKNLSFSFFFIILGTNLAVCLLVLEPSWRSILLKSCLVLFLQKRLSRNPFNILLYLQVSN
ncbi:unnamed protein product [Moneuplotes crassus]|uniref:Uncharacterized protein n=1 Tax=Euplotes crassus TaxID=5936 RepID=A0AAD1XXY5_EUPCR|nr:unnamed protein product [Moneuplotes crassus]